MTIFSKLIFIRQLSDDLYRIFVLIVIPFYFFFLIRYLLAG